MANSSDCAAIFLDREDNVMVTKKDFEIIATGLRLPREFAKLASEEYMDGYASAVGSIATALQVINPRFDTEKFYNWVINSKGE